MKHSEFNQIPDLAGKVIFITGGTSGLGLLAATTFAKSKPSHIYISGRNASKANEATHGLKILAPDIDVSFVQMDLSPLDTINAATNHFLTYAHRLVILLCNAGTMASPPALSTDGYEIQFATNFLGHALLIRHLLPLLLSTVAPKNHGIVFCDLRTTQDYGVGAKWTRYGQSKLAILLYTAELARRYPALSTVIVHPGVIATDLVTSLVGWIEVLYT